MGINRTPLRCYGDPECPACQAAAEFIRAAFPPNSCEFVFVGDDPVAHAGIAKLTGEVRLPVLAVLAPLGKKNRPFIIKGWNYGEYQRLAEDFRARFHPIAPDAAAGEGRNLQVVQKVEASG